MDGNSCIHGSSTRDSSLEWTKENYKILNLYRVAFSHYLIELMLVYELVFFSCHPKHAIVQGIDCFVQIFISKLWQNHWILVRVFCKVIKFDHAIFDPHEKGIIILIRSGKNLSKSFCVELVQFQGGQ